ncbi:MAG: hypothetical protein V4612_03750 [Pseudomonadota bacterium]
MNSQYLVNKKLDFTGIVLFGMIIATTIFFTSYYGFGFMVVAVLFAALIDIPHVLHTYARILSNKGEFSLYREKFLTSLFLISITALFFITRNQLWLLAMVWVYWQPYHVFKQNYGISKIYAKKNGYSDSIFLCIMTLLFGCLSPIIYRVSDTGLRFGNYSVFEKQLPFSNLVIPTPNLPIESSYVLYALFFMFLFLFFLEQKKLSLSKKQLPLIVIVMNLLTVSTYNIGYLYTQDLYALILIATSMHALQYHFICFNYQQRRQKENTDKLRIRIITKKDLLTYFAGLMICGIFVSSSELMFSGAIPLIIVLHHFYMDGVIWRRKKVNV